MNKKIGVLTVLALFLGAWLGVATFAQVTNATTGKESASEKGMMEEKSEPSEHGMMGKHHMGAMKMGHREGEEWEGHHMMKPGPIGCAMKGMMEKSLVGTPDGGVIVLMGNKIMKYDKNLNLVKEAEIKIDMEAMQKDMTEMMKNCPMMKGMMEREEEETR